MMKRRGWGGEGEGRGGEGEGTGGGGEEGIKLKLTRLSPSWVTQSNERTVDFVSMVEKVLLLVGSHILREKYLTSNPYRPHPLPDHSLQVTAGHFGSTGCKPAVRNWGPMLAVNGLGRKKLVKCSVMKNMKTYMIDGQEGRGSRWLCKAGVSTGLGRSTSQRVGLALTNWNDLNMSLIHY